MFTRIGRSIDPIAVLICAGVLLVVAATLVGCGQTPSPEETNDALKDVDGANPKAADATKLPDPKEGDGRRFEPRWWVGHATFSPDAKLLLTSYEFKGHTDERRHFPKVLSLWDTSSGKELWSVIANDLSGVGACDFLPQGEGVLVRCHDGLKVLDMAKGTVVRSFVKDDSINGVAVSPDGKLALTAGGPGPGPDGSDVQGSGLTLWDIARGKPIRTLGTGYVSRVTFSRDGKLGMAGSACGGHSVGNAVEVWDIPQRKLLLSLPCSEGWMPPIAFSPDAKLAVARRQNVHPDQGDGSGIAGLVVWEVATAKTVRVLPEFVGPAVAFAADGKGLLSINDSKNTLTLWDLATGKPKWRTDTGVVHACAVSPDGKLAFTSLGRHGPGMEMTLWDGVKGKRLRRLGEKPD
jgi:WD40 repeat protein